MPVLQSFVDAFGADKSSTGNEQALEMSLLDVHRAELQ
jgi:hypothetical protein